MNLQSGTYIIGLVILGVAPVGALPNADQYREWHSAWQKQVTQAAYPGEEIVAERVLYDYAAEHRLGSWNFEDGTRQGITYVDPNMKDVRVENGRLKFTLGAEKVVFGWGQLDKSYHQAYAAPLDMQTRGWHMAWKATLKVSQGPVQVKGSFCRFGKDAGGLKAEITRTNVMLTIPRDWPDNSVRAESYQGFGLIVTGPKGAQVEIDEVAAGWEVVRTYCRKAFELPPDDPVYAALVNVGLNNAAYINGVQVHDKEDLTGPYEYNLVPVELKTFLRPGTNVFGLMSELQRNGPFTYACGAVILASGRAIPLTMAVGYKVSPFPESGWNTVGFDDSAWKTPHTRSPAGLTYGACYPGLYFGPLLFENPSFSKLMYAVGKDVKVAVTLPAGFAQDNPVLSWSLTDSVTGRSVITNTLNQWAPAGAAIQSTLNAGALPAGIYDLAVTCRLAAQTNGLSRATPILVAGPVAQKETDSYEFEDGMKLTPVDEINCADPKDPHPYMDSEGSKRDNRIVKKGALAYRETGERRYRDYFAYRISIPEANLFQPHLVDIAWPDDAQRSLQVALLDDYDQNGATAGGLTGVTTFEKFPSSGTYQHLKAFWIPRWTNYFFVAANNMAGARAAVHKVTIQRIDDIPAFRTHPSGERYIGRMCERNTEHGNQLCPGPFARTLYSACGNVPQFHRRWYGANENLIKIMRFCGENLLANGVFQYDRNNLGYPPVWRARRSELDHNYQTMLARMFEAHGLILIPCLEIQSAGRYRMAGAEAVTLADKDGYQSALKIAAELAEEFRDFPAFRGLQMICFPPLGDQTGVQEAFMPAIASGYAGLVSGEAYTPLLAGYDDPMVEAFARDENIVVPVAPDDPDKYKKRYQWLKANCLAKWTAWRCRKVQEFNLQMLAAMRPYRPDVKLFPTVDFDVFLTKPIAKAGLDPVQFLKYAGYDPALSMDNDAISWPRFYNQMFHHNRSYGQIDWPLAEEFNTDPQLTAFWNQNRHRSAYILTHFDENFVQPDPGEFPPEFAGLKKRSTGWPKGAWPIFSTFMPPGEHCLAAFRDVIRDNDPQTLFYGWSDAVIPQSHWQYLRRITRAFVALPGDKFTPLTGNGLDKNIAVRELRKDGKYYFYVLNDTCWDVDVALALAGRGPVKDIGLNQSVAVNAGQLAFKLLPYEMRSFCQDGAGGVKAAATRPAPAGKKYVEDKTNDLNRALAGNAKVRQVFRGPILTAFTQALAGAQSAVSQDDLGRAMRSLNQGVVQSLASYGFAGAAALSTWYVIGCFPGDKFQIGFKQAYPVEVDVLADGRIIPEKTYQGDTGYEKAMWRKVISETVHGIPGCIMLDNLYGRPDYREAYAYSCVYSPAGRQCTLQVRSDDGVRVWLNGALVLDHNISRGINWDPDRVAVNLKPGWNWMLVKLENIWSGWGFQVSFLKPDGLPFNDMAILCDPDQAAGNQS